MLSLLSKVEVGHWWGNWSSSGWGMEAMWVWFSGRATLLASLDRYIWLPVALFIVHCSNDTLLSCKYTCRLFFLKPYDPIESFLYWGLQLVKRKICFHFNQFVTMHKGEFNIWPFLTWFVRETSNHPHKIWKYGHKIKTVGAAWVFLYGVHKANCWFRHRNIKFGTDLKPRLEISVKTVNRLYKPGEVKIMTLKPQTTTQMVLF